MKFLSFTWFATIIFSLLFVTQATGQHNDSLRAKIGDRPQDLAHSLYTGTFGKTRGIYLLQWYSNQVRGVFIDQNISQEVRLYGSNAQPGRAIMEVWQPNKHNGTGVVNKRTDSSGRLTWQGTIHITELLEYRVHMVKYSPKGANTVTSTCSYLGNLGSAPIKVNLNWYANGVVRGHYTNLKNSKSYKLKGYNYANGKLYLDEWTTSYGDVEGGAVTARVSLRKITIKGKIQWQGRMFNMDRRSFPMTFSRTGSSGTSGINNVLENKLR